jgi:hypothetical protein
MVRLGLSFATPEHLAAIKGNEQNRRESNAIALPVAGPGLLLQWANPYI